MGMIVHEAIPDQSKLMQGEMPYEQTEIDLAVVIREVNGLAMVSPLSHVVDPAGDNNASEACHR